MPATRQRKNPISHHQQCQTAPSLKRTHLVRSHLVRTRLTRTHLVRTTLSLRAQRGNPVAVATTLRRHVPNLIKIATSLCPTQLRVQAGTHDAAIGKSKIRTS